MAVQKEMTVAVDFTAEFDTIAPGEPEAVMRASQKVLALEEALNKMGYTVEMGRVRVRRPRTAEKAQEREAERRRNGGRGTE